MRNTLLALLGFIFLSSPLAASAQDQYGDFLYVLEGPGCYYFPGSCTATIVGYTGPGGAVIIPADLSGSVPVIAIGDNAFYAQPNLTSITIPNSVTRIGAEAFALCDSLTSITVDAANTSYSSLDGVLFDKNQTTLIQCPGGKAGSYAIPASVATFVEGAFNNCTSLTNVTIPGSVTSIGGGAFYNCPSLTAITVDAANASFSSLDGVLFDKNQTTLIQCPGGKAGSYSIPASVARIATDAFSGCVNLTNVTIPGSLTSIGDLSFSDCSSLMAITVDATNASYSSSDGVLFNKNQTTLIECPAGKAGSYAIPGSVASIGEHAFENCTSLTNVTIPGRVTGIGSSAFYYCAGLTSITIPANVTSIEGGAFGYCTSLTNVTILNGTIGDWMFSDCTSLTNIAIPANVTSIGSGAFAHTGLTTVTIPDGVTSIRGVTFYSCTNLTSVTIPGSVTSIGDAAFSFCTSLTGITIPGSVTRIGAYAFEKCTRLTNVTILNGVTSIGGFAFYYCTSLSSVTIPGSVTSIGDDAFVVCTSLAGVFFRGNAPSVGSYEFDGTTKVIVYYLPGTTGWAGTFAGRPTRLWNPLMQTSGPNFGVRPAGFGFNITGTADIPIVVEACTNLGTASWVALQSLNLTNGACYFSDPEWTNHPARFYGLRSP